MLMEFLRNLAMGAVADEVRKTPQGQKLQEEYVKPVAETVLGAFAPVDTRASSIGTQLDAEGYPTNSPMLEAQTAPYRPNASFKAEPISPYELQDMARMVAGEQQSRQGELDQLIAAENAQNAQGVQDFVRQNTATEKLSQEQAAAKVTETAKRLQAEAPDAKEDEVIAAAVVEEGKNDPSFFDAMGDKIGDFFGSEKNMLGLALAFNSLRYQPDQGLASVLGKRLETIGTTETAKAKAPAIAAQLKSMGYNKMAEYALANPTHAEKIYEKALGADLKAPTKFDQLRELAKTPDGRAQIKEWKDLGVIGGQTINVGGSAGEKLAVADVQPIYQAAFAAPKQIQKIDETLDVLESGGANTGLFSNLKQARDRFLAELGGEDAAQRASQTQLLNAFLGSEVFSMISKLGLGSRGMDTPAEREFLREVMTGKVDLTPQALIALANRRREAEIGAIEDYEREKDSPAMKSYASQRSAIGYTSKDFERKKPKATTTSTVPAGAKVRTLEELRKAAK
jgi:hypothetical protein